MSSATPSVAVEESVAADKPAVKEEEPEVVDLADDDDDLPNGKQDNGAVKEEEKLQLGDMEVLDKVKEESDSEMAEVKSQNQQTDAASDQDKEGEEASPANTDPYAYLSQGGFSSENFKIELRGMPKYYGLAELKKLLNETLKLGSNKVKPPRQGNHLFVCFRSEENKKQALEILNGYTWKNSTLTALHAKPAQDPLVRKRKQQAEQQEASQKKVAKGEIELEEQLRMNTIPYHSKPYESQLECKMEAMRKTLRQMSGQLSKVHPELRGWLKQQELKFDGLPCELKPIRPSPTLDGYRNKCEFTIGLHPETQKPTVGFRLGSYASGEVGVFPADGLRHIPDQMKQVAKVFEQLVLASPLPPFHPEKREGVWQTLAVRSTRGGELMVMVVCQVGALTPEQVAELTSEVTTFFSEGPGKELGVNSLFLHPLSKKEKGVPVPPPELLLGEPYVTEDLLGLKLRISPLAFFQVNTLAAEELYSAVAELAAPSPDTTLLDICCGTGSIGLSLAKDCGQVLGLEIVAAAVEDAKANALANGLSHCNFFAGSAEAILSPVIARATRPQVVGVLDPPRPGIAHRVIATIRRCAQLERLVYMACCPQAALHNFRDLGRASSKTMGGHPFLPVCAIPVDLFPHTPHCELVVLFERTDPATLPPKPATSSDELDRGDEARPPPRKRKQRRRNNKNQHEGAPSNARVQLFVTGGGCPSGPSDAGKEKLRQTQRGAASIRRGKFPMWQSPNQVTRKGLPPVLPASFSTRSLQGFGRGLGPMRATLGLPQPGFRRPPFLPPGPQKPGLLEPLRGPVQAERLGRSWAGQLPMAALQNAEAMRLEEEEAVRRFKEGFAAAVRDGQARLQAEESFPERVVHQRTVNTRFPGVNGHDKPFGEQGGPIRQEKMIPESVVNKMLAEYRREAQQSDRFADAERFEPSRGGVKIREIYIEKETWPDNQRFFPASNKPRVTGATAFYGAVQSNYKEPLLPTIPIYNVEGEQEEDIQHIAVQGKRKRQRKPKKTNPNGNPHFSPFALQEDFQVTFQTSPPRAQLDYQEGLPTPPRAQQHYQGGQTNPARTQQDIFIDDTIIPREQKNYQGFQKTSPREQKNYQGGQMGSAKPQQNYHRDQQMGSAKPQQNYQGGQMNFPRAQQNRGQITSPRAEQSYQGGPSFKQNYHESLASSPRTQQGYQGAQMASNRTQEIYQGGQRTSPRGQRYQGGQMASDQQEGRQDLFLEVSILPRGQRYQGGQRTSPRGQRYQGGQMASARNQQEGRQDLFREESTLPRDQMYQEDQMASARNQQEGRQDLFREESILPRGQQRYQGGQMASARAQQLPMDPPWQLKQHRQASRDSTWQEHVEEFGSSPPPQDIRTRLAPPRTPQDNYHQTNKFDSDFIQPHTVNALYGKSPTKSQGRQEWPAQSPNKWGAPSFY